MGRKAQIIQCTTEIRKELERISRSLNEEIRLVRRAKIILGCLDGKRIIDIAKDLNEQECVIIKWRDRFASQGITGLYDTARSGKPVIYGDEWKAMVLKKLEEEPPNNQTRWDGPTLAKALDTSEDAIQRFLQREGIQLARMRTWCISTDPEFAAKAADIVGLYLNPPEKALVLCIDEKPSMQALSRRTGYIKTSNGKVMRAIKSTYKRNGTQNLFAALEVATGVIHGKTTKSKKRPDFLLFMTELLKELPADESTMYHVILDNYCIHKRCDEWLANNPNVIFHFTPTSASWLNMVEVWFNILTRKVLRGASFDTTSALSDAILGYIKAYNETAEPFVWKKREVYGSQIKNNLANLRG